ncbi:MAG: LamG domain-containing protein, partial [Nanoarchaeota archaeon]
MTKFANYKFSKRRGTLLSGTLITILDKGETVSGAVGGVQSSQEGAVSDVTNIGFPFVFDNKTYTKFRVAYAGIMQLISDDFVDDDLIVKPNSHWSFDGKDTITGSNGLIALDTIGNFSGTVRGGVTTGSAGYHKESFFFNANINSNNTSVEFGKHTYDFERTDKYSFSAWVKLPTGDAGTRTIIAKSATSGDPNMPNRGYSFDAITGGGNHKIRFVLSNTSTNRVYVDTVQAINDNTWYFLTLTYDGSSTAAGVKIYVSGSSYKTTVVEDTLTNTTKTSESGSFAVGALIDRAHNVGSVFSGSIDEVSVWKNRVLTPSEVITIYNEQRNKFISVSGSIHRMYFQAKNNSFNTIPILGPIFAPWWNYSRVAEDSGKGISYFLDSTNGTGNRKLIVDFRLFEWYTQREPNNFTVLPFQIVLYEG